MGTKKKVNVGLLVFFSVDDPWHFGVDPDLDPQMHSSDPDPAIFVSNLYEINKKLI